MRRYVIWCMVAGGALAGLAGMGQLSALQLRLNPGLSPGFGYIGFLISWLAGHNPRLIVPMAFLLAVLASSGDILQITQGLPSAIVNVLAAIADADRPPRPGEGEGAMNAAAIASMLAITLALTPSVLYATFGEIIGQRGRDREPRNRGRDADRRGHRLRRRRRGPEAPTSASWRARPPGSAST